MREVDLFNNYEPISPDLLFKKVVRITMELDYDYLYKKLVDLNYNDTMHVKEDLLRIAVESKCVVDTFTAKQKYWDRIVKHLSDNFNYHKPVSGTEAADRMRKHRAR